MSSQQDISIFTRLTELVLLYLKSSSPNDSSHNLTSCLRNNGKTKSIWEWSSKSQQCKKTVHWSPDLEEVLFFHYEREETKPLPILTRNCPSRQGRNAPLQKDFQRLKSRKTPLFTSSNDSFESAEIRRNDTFEVDESKSSFKSNLLHNNLESEFLDFSEEADSHRNVETIVRPDGCRFVIIRAISNEPWDYIED